MKRAIFISYRLFTSSAPFAGRIRDRLDRIFPGRVFMDVADIPPGENFLRAIDMTMKKCSVVVAVIGDQWDKPSGGRKFGDADDYVAYELSTALQSGIPIVPTLIPGGRMPPEGGLPDPLKSLAHMRAFEIRHVRFEDDISDLVGEMYKKLHIKPPNVIETFLGRNQPISEFQRALMAIVGGVLGVFTVFVAIAIGRDDLEAVVIFGLFALFFWPLGKNSFRLGWFANTGAAAVALSGLIAIGRFVASLVG